MKSRQVSMVAVTLLLGVGPVDAGVASKVVQEAVELTTRKFAKEAAQEGVEGLSKRMTRLAAQHGDEVVSTAFQKCGPRVGKIVDEAGEQADIALRLIAQHGDEAIAVASRASARQLVSQHGDDAARVLIRHGTVAEPVVEEFAERGVQALGQVTLQNGRRLSIMNKEGSLAAPMLDVVATYGNRACEFIWRNKGALATGAVLATFVASPEPYLDGSVQLTGIVAEHVVPPLASEVLAPIAATPQAVAVEVAKGTNWTVLGIMTLLLATVTFASKGRTHEIVQWVLRAVQAVRRRWTNRPR